MIRLKTCTCKVGDHARVVALCTLHRNAPVLADRLAHALKRLNEIPHDYSKTDFAGIEEVLGTVTGLENFDISSLSPAPAGPKTPGRYAEPREAPARPRSGFFWVSGSNGTLVCDASTGGVFGPIIFEDGQDPSEYKGIHRIDVAEWQKTYQRSINGAHLDILDVGYWHRRPGPADEVYEPPVGDWRKEFRN